MRTLVKCTHPSVPCRPPALDPASTSRSGDQEPVSDPALSDTALGKSPVVLGMYSNVIFNYQGTGKWISGTVVGISDENGSSGRHLYDIEYDDDFVEHLVSSSSIKVYDPEAEGYIEVCDCGDGGCQQAGLPHARSYDNISQFLQQAFPNQARPPPPPASSQHRASERQPTGPGSGCGHSRWYKMSTFMRAKRGLLL